MPDNCGFYSKGVVCLDQGRADEPLRDTSFSDVSLNIPIFDSYPILKGKSNTVVGNKVNIQMDEGVNEEQDGSLLARISSMEIMLGKNYMDNQPGYGQHYIEQVQIKMQSAVVGGNWASLGPTYTPYPYLDSGRKTTNFYVTNSTWVPLTDQLTTTSGGYAALGSNPDTIYFGMGDPYDRVGVGGYFTKSTDGDSTWSTPIDLSTFDSNTARVTRVYTLVVDTSTGSDIILISTNMGIFRSTDGGMTFTNPYVLGSSAYYPAIYSLVKTGSSSGGRTWWMGHDSYNQKLIVSTNQGQSWGALAGTNWATITSSNAARTSFSVGAAGEATVYALVTRLDSYHQLDVLKSTNGGVTWTSCKCNGNYAPTNPIPNLQTTLDILADQGWYNHLLLVDPSDSTRKTVYIGGQLAAAKTTNGGTSWSIISTWYNADYYKAYYGVYYVHADHHAAAYTISSSGVGTVIFGTDGGSFMSQDKGAS
eukprot:gene3342-6613_t